MRMSMGSAGGVAWAERLQVVARKPFVSCSFSWTLLSLSSPSRSNRRRLDRSSCLSVTTNTTPPPYHLSLTTPCAHLLHAPTRLPSPTHRLDTVADSTHSTQTITLRSGTHRHCLHPLSHQQARLPRHHCYSQQPRSPSSARHPLPAQLRVRSAAADGAGDGVAPPLPMPDTERGAPRVKLFPLFPLLLAHPSLPLALSS